MEQKLTVAQLAAAVFPQPQSRKTSNSNAAAPAARAPFPVLLLPTSGAHAFAIATQIKDEVAHDIHAHHPSGKEVMQRGSRAASHETAGGTVITTGESVTLTNISVPHASHKLEKEVGPLLDTFKSARLGLADLAKLPRKLRAYYNEQNDLIDFYLNVERGRERQEAERERGRLAAAADTGSDGLSTHRNSGSAAGHQLVPGEEVDEREEEAQARMRVRKAIAFAINISFAANVVLLIIKVYAAIISSSLAVIASTVDSVLDLFSGAVVWASAKLAARRSPYMFPVGKSRFEPVSIIVFAAVMGVASLQIIEQGAIALASGVRDGPPAPDTDYRTFIILGAIVLIKAALLGVCYGLRHVSPSVGALALDHLADIVTNGGTLVAVALASKYTDVWFLDPGTAILLAVWMVVMWSAAAKEQIHLIASQTATPHEIGEITYLAMTHDPAILAVDTVLAYSVGNRLQVEVDIVLPKEMALMHAHDIGETLQNSIERLDNVERAFCHLDTDFEHSRSIEHASPWA